MVIKEEFLRFCQCTTFKGIPRAVKSDDRGIRITWIICSFIFLGFGTYQTYLLLADYLGYPSFMYFYEEDAYTQKHNPELPVITLCNENRISPANFANLSEEVPTVDEYFEAVDQLSDDPECTSFQAQMNGHVLKKKVAYFETIGRDIAEAIGYTQEQFILRCREIILYGTTYILKPCSDLVSITLHQSSDYFNCYQVELSRKYKAHNGQINGISLDLYLDNIATDLTETTQRLNESVAGRFSGISPYGAIATVTHKDGYPFFRKDGIFLAPGTHTKIKAKKKVLKRLPEPHGSCSDSTNKASEYREMCLTNCYQDMVRKACNCTDSQLGTDLDEGQYEYCKKMGSNPNVLFERMNCNTNMLTSGNEKQMCNEKCQRSCVENQYSTSMSNSKFPHMNSMKKFYDQNIAGKEFEDKFQIVQDVIENNCSDHMGCVSNLMMAQKLIEDNFLRVDLMAPEDK